MKTTTIGQLTIHRLEPGEKVPDHLTGKSPGRLFINGSHTDEEILATVECTRLHDDERSAGLAAGAHTVVTGPYGVAAGNTGLMIPAAACVAKKARSIRARQDAIAAGVAAPDTPLVGNPTPTRVLAPDPV